MNENNGNGMNGNNEYNGPGGNGDARPLTFEEQISRLEQIVARLEHGDAPLAESLTLFEEGTRLAASCSAQLDQAEQKVVRLMKGPDGAPVETPFADEEPGEAGAAQ